MCYWSRDQWLLFPRNLGTCSLVLLSPFPLSLAFRVFKDQTDHYNHGVMLGNLRAFVWFLADCQTLYPWVGVYRGACLLLESLSLAAMQERQTWPLLGIHSFPCAAHPFGL